MTIGYEISVTAIQMVNAYACIANDGNMMVPRLVKEIRNKEGEIIKYFPPTVARRVISLRTAQTVKEILRQTVEWGTGEKANIPGYDVCGKTGTARKFDRRLQCYSSKKILASFIGFAPLHKPELVIGIFLDEPQKHLWGSSAAAPVFKRLAEQVLRYQNVQPSYLYAIDLENIDRLQIDSFIQGVPQTANVLAYSSRMRNF